MKRNNLLYLIRHCEERSNLFLTDRLLRAKSPRNDEAIFRKYLCFLILIILFSSCNNTPQSNTNTNLSTVVKPDSFPAQKEEAKQADNFVEAYSQFVIALQSKNTQEINKYINSNAGLYVIESRGAMPSMTRITDITTFKTKNNKSVLDIDAKKFDCSLTMDTLPVVNCDRPNFYSMSGCFAKKESSFDEDKIWTFCSLDKNMMDAVEVLSETIVYTVINTNNFRYYFSFIDGKWTLTFIDIRRPCTA